MKKRLIAFPTIGKYTAPLRRLLEDIGCDVLAQIPVTQQMVQRGCRHSSDMMCFPFKYTLGYFMEALDRGANTLLMYDSGGQCRFKHYHVIQEYILRNQGYTDFEMVPIRGKHLISSLKHITDMGSVRILCAMRHVWKEFVEVEVMSADPCKPTIGVIGEIYTVMEDALNYGIERRIVQAGMNPHVCVTMTHFLKGGVTKHFDAYSRRAEGFFNGALGGHGIENVASTLMAIEKGFSGLIWFRPLSCMPESTVDPIIRSLCDGACVPLLTIDVDETNSEANVSTRIETFFELVQSRVGHITVR